MKKLITLLIVLICCVGTVGASTLIHLLPGLWDASDATERYALYLYWDGGDKWLPFSKGDFNAWDVTIDDEHAYTGMILCRMNGSESENKWDNKWNQTSDITSIPTTETWYEIKAAGNGDNYDVSTSPKTIYVQERGTGAEAPELYCWNGSVTYNGSFPGYTLSGKTVDTEIWYGFYTISGTTCIISNNGDTDKTGNITLPSSDVFYFYYPNSRSYANTESKFVSGTYKYATYGSSNKIYLGFLPENVTAKLLKVADGELVPTTFTGDLIAGEGVMFDNETGEDITLHLPVATGTPTANTDNQLVAITEATLLSQTVDDCTNYILTNKKADGTTGDVKFYKVNTSGSYVNSGTAYLKVPNGGSLARESLWFGEDETTDINTLSIERLTLNDNAPMFNIAGQRVAKDYKGIVIQNGRKYVVK